ncbi:MAG: hypothetical protein ACRYE7_00305 [Janthinobacterium lividum]
MDLPRQSLQEAGTQLTTQQGLTNSVNDDDDDERSNDNDDDNSSNSDDDYSSGSDDACTSETYGTMTT